MSSEAQKAPVKPTVPVTPANAAARAEIVGDLFQIVNESEATALMQTRGNFDLAEFWKDLSTPNAKGKTALGEYLNINLNGFVKRYCPDSTGTKHLNTNVQKKLRDFLGVNVAVRKVKGNDTIILKVPLKLPEKKEPEKKKDGKK